MPIRIYKSGEEISTAENGKHSMIWRTEKNNSSICLVNFIRYIKSRSNMYCCVSFYEKYNQCKIPFRTGNIINNYSSSRYLANTIDGISFQSLICWYLHLNQWHNLLRIIHCIREPSVIILQFHHSITIELTDKLLIRFNNNFPG